MEQKYGKNDENKKLWARFGKINPKESKYQKWGQNGPKIITLEQNELKMAKTDENKPKTGKNIGN